MSSIAINADMVKFIQVHTDSGKTKKYRGLFGKHEISSDKPGDFRPKYFFQADDNNKIQQIISHIAKVKNDIYITANQMLNPTKRSYENLFAVSNIVVDCDCHDQSNTNAHRLWDILETEVFSKGVLPHPSGVVFSGRGIQIWWHIVPVPVKVKKNYIFCKNVIEGICDILKSYMPDGWNVDYGCSKNLCGWVRFPGSYNTKAQKYGTFQLFETEKRTIWDFKPYKKEKEQDGDSGLRSSLAIGTMSLRQAQLITLIEIRNRNIEGVRHNFMLIMACTLYAQNYSHDEIKKYLFDINNKLQLPLEEHEISRLITYLTSEKKWYKWKNESIIQRLSMSEEEIIACGMNGTDSPLTGHASRLFGYLMMKLTGKDTRRPNRTRDRERATRKEARISKILDLHKEGFKNTEIARVIGVCAKTVAKYIKMFNDSLSQPQKQQKQQREQQINKIKNNLQISAYHSTKPVKFKEDYQDEYAEKHESKSHKYYERSQEEIALRRAVFYLIILPWQLMKEYKQQQFEKMIEQELESQERTYTIYSEEYEEKYNEYCYEECEERYDDGLPF